MKSAIVVFLCLVAVSLASPQTQDRVVALLRDDRVDQGDGNFNYAFAADNGLEMEVSGAPGAEGAVSMRGYYVLPLESEESPALSSWPTELDSSLPATIPANSSTL
ncbi:cuticle protein AM/CP1114-like [Macrobrachium nipponense]|uniref:cuticle protein AM/CP1114-like n=1 Tax=Macrobrachium nipponense TaxID=159736 RepID=UPI0030C84451